MKKKTNTFSVKPLVCSTVETWRCNAVGYAM